MKKYLILAALLLASTAAFATNNNGDDEGCRGNCGSSTQPASYDQDQGQSQAQGQHQAQEANASAGAVAGASNTTVVGVGVGVDTRDYNTNNVRAEGGDSYSHGGVQGQQQGISDSGNSSARGGDQAQTQGIVDSGNSSNSNINSNRNDSTAINEGNNAAQSTDITFEAAKSYKHTPDATAPGIYTSNSCAQGFGVGVAGPGYGASVGGNKIDKGCTVRENARILAGVDSSLAIEYLCRNKNVDIGETLGELCKPKLVPEPPVVTYPEPEVPVTVITEDVKG
jgi:hypothetical protein